MDDAFEGITFFDQLHLNTPTLPLASNTYSGLQRASRTDCGRASQSPARICTVTALNGGLKFPGEQTPQQFRGSQPRNRAESATPFRSERFQAETGKEVDFLIEWVTGAHAPAPFTMR